MSDRTKGSGLLCAALLGWGDMLRRLLGSKRTLLLGMNTRVQENSQNGELKVGPSPRQPGPWTIPSGREGGVHPGMYHWLPHHFLCVCGSPSPQKRPGARPSQALHVERRVPADRQSPQARSAQGAVVHKVLPQFIPYVQWAGRGKKQGCKCY